jgi:histidyl-tRNA synthetase
MKCSSIRGTKDILPAEVGLWQYIEEVSRKVFSYYNYQEIRTPIFESTELFARGIGDSTDIVEKEMYTFLDKGGRSLTLRPESTASVVRAYIQHSMHKMQKVTKLYYAGPQFRYERPQAGRFRQFHQIGIESLGTQEPFADAEVISLGVHLFDELGLSDLSVTINSSGCAVCRPVIEERIKQFLGSSLDKLCSDCQRRFEKQPLRILDCKNKKCNNYFSAMPPIEKSLCQECTDHFNSVLEYLDSLGIVFNINPRLVRGLDYYNRTVFEIVSDQLGAQNAVCGGGRYDKLVGTFGGPKTPAVGFAFGVERTVMILESLLDKPKEEKVDLFIVALGELQRKKCFFILDEMRRTRIKSEMSYADVSLKAQLKQANRLNAKYALIVGEEEVEKGVAILKKMETSDQEEIALDDVVNVLEEMVMKEG